MDNASVHHDEHILPNRNLHPEQFGSAGPLGAVFSRTGGQGGTSDSENAEHVADAGHRAGRASSSWATWIG